MYHLQLAQLHQRLIHTRLVNLKLLLFLPQSTFQVYIALSILRVDILQRPCLVLCSSQHHFEDSYPTATNPKSFFQIGHFPVVLCQH